jgi:hypothetical protein
MNDTVLIGTISVRVPRAADVDAVLAAIDFMQSGKVYVERRYFFELLAVAHWMQVCVCVCVEIWSFWNFLCNW